MCCACALRVRPGVGKIFTESNGRARRACAVRPPHAPCYSCKATSARDRTTYGRARNSTRLFYLHHTRLIAKAAVVNDAMGIREQVQGLRQRVCAAHAAASGWP